jgi:uncharacterized protein YoxC
MSPVFEAIIAFSVLAAVIAFIWVMVDLKSVIKDVRQIVETAENTLKTTTVELNENLKVMKNLLQDINVIADHVKEMSGAARAIGGNVLQITHDIRDTVDLVKGIPATASAQFAAVRAGIQTGAVVFLKNLIWGRTKEEEEQNKEV